MNGSDTRRLFMTGGVAASAQSLGVPDLIYCRTCHDSAAILRLGDCDVWRNPGVEDREDLQPLLNPYQDELQPTPVSTLVNCPRNESAGCIEAVGRQGELF